MKSRLEEDGANFPCAHTHTGSTSTLPSHISDTVEPLQDDMGISEAALVPVGMGLCQWQS